MKHFYFLILIGLIFNGVSYAAPSDIDELQKIEKNKWSLLRDDQRHNITTYTKWENDKKYRTFKFTVIYDATLDEVMKVALDLSTAKQWYFRLKEAKILRRLSDYSLQYSMLFAGTITEPDREVLATITVTTPASKTNKTVKLTYKSDDTIPLQHKGTVRGSFYQEIEYTPTSDGKVLATSEGYFDPGGNPPAWAANYVQRRAAYETLLSMQRFITLQRQLPTTAPLQIKYKED